MKHKIPAKVANLNRTTVIIIITLLLILSACVDPTPTPGSDSSPSYDATATYGADQFCQQLKALGTPCP